MLCRPPSTDVRAVMWQINLLMKMLDRWPGSLLGTSESLQHMVLFTAKASVLFLKIIWERPDPS